MTQSSRFAFLSAYVISITHCVLKVSIRILGACIDNHYHHANLRVFCCIPLSPVETDDVRLALQTQLLFWRHKI